MPIKSLEMNMTKEEDDYIQEELNNATIQYQNWNRQNYNKNKNRLDPCSTVYFISPRSIICNLTGMTNHTRCISQQRTR
jgi:hypothetical protein